MRQPFGQNFLVDKNISEKIVSAAELTKNDTVIEIGPGKGALTGLLGAAARKVLALEIAEDLVPGLRSKFAGQENVEIAEGDALEFDFVGYKTPFKLVANLPYNVATKLLQNILPGKQWARAIVMVQKEVAERITAQTRTKAYGSFSIFCRYYAEAKILFYVPPLCFFPKPKVDSAVVILVNKCPREENPGFLKLARLAFQTRRKTIVNSLKTNTHFSKEKILAALNNSHIGLMARPEELTLEQFQALDSYLNN
jgi:16S rRNA (adenine1518-N6/adenine1519-N6)-dimethyltransferase